MVPNSDQDFGIKPAEEGDHRITKVGKILRAMGLDELPQIINILLGEMSFVGPRSLAVGEIEIIMNKIKRVRILDVPVDNIDMSFCLKYISALIEKKTNGNYILAINPEKVITLQKEYHLKQVFENAALLIPDGIGVVLAMQWLFSLPAKRVPGADLMRNICKVAANKGYRIFIYGSKEAINKQAKEKLKLLYPGISIVGRCNGYIRKERMDKLINDINSSEADILFVGLGSPKQEKWIQEYLPKLNVKVCQGIGGTLDTITGDTKRAPWYFQKAGVEWFYRLIKDPKRFRRQAILPIFAIRVIKEKLKGRLP